MAKTSIPSSFFVFTVVMHEGRFLVVRERKYGQRWYAPAGRLEQGETIAEAAVRETMEEASVLVEPTMLLRIDQNWTPLAEPEGGAELSSWWRFVLIARPATALVAPKSVPDHHTLEARWLTLHEIARLPLRHPEVVEIFALAAAARPALATPLSMRFSPAVNVSRFAD